MAGAEYSPCLRGPEVILLPDNDEAGRKHVAQVGNHLRGIAARVRVLALPGFPEKADIADWVANGGTAAALAELVANAPDFQTTAHRYETKPEPSPNPAASLDGFDLTEDGIGLAFAKAHQDLLRYDHSIGRWFQWTGKAWRQDETRLAFSWARRTCRQLANEAGAEGKLLVVLAKAATAAAVERFAQSDPALAVTSAIWDSDPFLLGTPSGTLDLRTGELRDTFMEDFITKLTSVTPSVMPDCPLVAGVPRSGHTGQCRVDPLPQAMVRLLPDRRYPRTCPGVCTWPRRQWQRRVPQRRAQHHGRLRPQRGNGHLHRVSF